MFACEYCNQQFTRVDSMLRHKSSCKKHVGVVGVGGLKSELKCFKCDKTFTRQDNFNRHLSTCRSRCIKRMEKRHRVGDDDDNDDDDDDGGEPATKKQRCELCNIDVLSLHNHQKSVVHKQKQSCEMHDEKTEIIASAFKSRIISYRLFTKEKHLIPKDFMQDVSQPVVNLIDAKILEMRSAVKVNLVLFAKYTKWLKINTDGSDGGGDDNGDDGVNEEREVEEIKSFNTKNKVIRLGDDEGGDDGGNMSEIYDSFIDEICVKADDFQERDSGWAITEVLYLEVNINKFSPLKGSSYIPLLKWVQAKKACVNVKNNDIACFFWAVTGALYPVEMHSDRVTSYPHYEEVLNTTGIERSVALSDIKKFEVLNNISINVYEISSSEETIVGPIYHTKERRKNHVNLLLIEEGGKSHYCWIKNLSRLISTQISKHHHQMWLCDGCLLSFTNNIKFEEHIKRDCSHIKTILPNDRETILKFKDFRYQLQAPVVVYADFEALLKPIATCLPHQSSSYTVNYQLHEPYSFGYYIKCSYDDTQSKFVMYRGQDCAKEFLRSLEIELAPYIEQINRIVPIHPLTETQKADFQSAVNCHICGGVLGDDRVRDHDHLTGAYRAAAHYNCNLNYSITYKIPIVMHNFSGYDAHFITRALQKYDDINVIPKNKESFISFSIKSTVLKIELRFIDSFRFIAASLDKLVRNLSKTQFYNITSHFNSDKVALLHRKGVFPYEYIDCWEKLDEKSLPPREAFYSSLTNAGISIDDYNHAQKMWNVFNVKTLGEYSDVYLKSDVLLLADVFENFREVCLETYKLDPAHYFTAPGLSWQAMLKHTKVELELFTDIAMMKFISNGIRGGLSQCCEKFAVANNKYIENYDSDEPSNYIVYLDANNLYGWAMSQYLPIRDFRWLSENGIENLNIMRIQSDDATGYILDVDLEYPAHLHDAHNDIPFCPENKIPPIGDGKTCKLLATLEGKSNYIIHYINLQQAIKHGLKVKKIHRVLAFTQSPWLKSYIDLNTSKRTAAKNAFEKDFYKLMNNAVFGKTMENVEKRVDVRVISSWESWGKRLGARALISRLNFHSSSIINEDISIVQMRRSSVKYDKPIYAGFTILELSKTLMYDFHYDYILPKYGSNIRLLYTDTDSFIYNIITNDFYNDIKSDLEDRFDTSDMKGDNIYSLPRVNKKVIGKMKDEANGQIITKFIGIRSKCYYIEKADGEVIKKIKGIKKNVVDKNVSGEDYYNCIMGAPPQYRRMCVIRSRHHEIYTQSVNKVALKNYDDKRFSTPDMPHQTLALGHNRLET